MNKKNKTCCNDIYKADFKKEELPDEPEEPDSLLLTFENEPPPIEIKTPPVPQVPTTLEDFLPLALYYDNDEPDKRTRRTTTKRSYEETYIPYISRKYEFIEEYNNDRPHEALEMKYPGEVYKASSRKYEGLQDLEYPYHDRTITVTNCGRICMGGRKINFSRVFAGQDVGVRQVDDKIWLVSFMQYDLGYFDEEIARVEPGANPFGAKVLPM